MASSLCCGGRREGGVWTQRPRTLEHYDPALAKLASIRWRGRDCEATSSMPVAFTLCSGSRPPWGRTTSLQGEVFLQNLCAVAAPASNVAPEAEDQASLLLRAEPVLSDSVTQPLQNPSLSNSALYGWATELQLPLSSRGTVGLAQKAGRGCWKAGLGRDVPCSPSPQPWLLDFFFFSARGSWSCCFEEGRGVDQTEVWAAKPSLLSESTKLPERVGWSLEFLSLEIFVGLLAGAVLI